MKLTKSTLLCVIIGFVLALGLFSKTEAKTFTFPKVVPDTNPIHLLFPVGEHVTLLKTGATTKGRYTLANFLIPPGGGPLPHIHHREDEWFYVVDGDLQLQIGFTNYPSEKSVPGNKAVKETFHTINAKPGTLIYTPRYHLHRFENIGKKPVNLLTVWAPSGIENYFQEAAQAMPDPLNPPPLDSEKHKKLFVSVAPKYGISQSSYAEQYVKKVDNKVPAAILKDNHAKELLKLLSPDIEKR